MNNNNFIATLYNYKEIQKDARGMYFTDGRKYMCIMILQLQTLTVYSILS